MINPHLPLELDNGEPVELSTFNDTMIYARIKGSWARNHQAPGGVFWYARKTGVFGGSNKHEAFVLRNVDLDEGLEDL